MSPEEDASQHVWRSDIKDEDPLKARKTGEMVCFLLSQMQAERGRLGLIGWKMRDGISCSHGFPSTISTIRI